MELSGPSTQKAHMSTQQHEALRLADLMNKPGPVTTIERMQVDCELRRLHAENEALRAAYWKMRNAAAGYSNYCEDSASVRRCERDMVQAESMYREATYCKTEG